MNNFEYHNPVRIIFGAGELKRVGVEAAKLGKKICLVGGKAMKHTKPVVERVEQLLEQEGLELVCFYEIENNPEIDSIRRGAALCKSEGADLVVAVGGGSVMDAAKAIAAGVFYEGDLWNMVFSRHDHVHTVIPTRSLPTLMIPTLPATGSEMNNCAVISNRELKEKSYIWSPCLYPVLAIIDPELTVTLPPYATACAAADAISHVFEIYVNGEEDSDLQHYFQEGVMRTIIDNVGKAQAHPDDISARAHLQWAATCAINGWASPGDAWTPIHQVGHVLTSRHGVQHGASLAVLMPAWMEHMSKRRPDCYFRFARNVMQILPDGKSKEEVIAAGIEAFRQFLGGIGLTLSLREMGIGEGDLAAIADDVVKISFGEDGLMKCNPPVSRDDVMAVLRLAY